MKTTWLTRISLLICLSVLIPAGFANAQASCDDGTSGDDEISCGTSPTGNDLDADLGNDTLTIERGVEVTNVQGDGMASDADPGSNPPDVSDPVSNQPGGNDTIRVKGRVLNEVSGDYLADAHGGNDKITIDLGAYALAVSGDGITTYTYSTQSQGGDDSIVVNGGARTVNGDNAFYGAGGNDTIMVGKKATVETTVAGDNAAFDGGDDVITIDGKVTGITNEEGFFPGVVAGDQASGVGGDDVISINGTVMGDVYGDQWVRAGGNDTITVKGLVSGNVDGDYNGDLGGDDAITITGTVQGDVNGDTCINGGADTITINGRVDGDVRGDNLYGSGAGGNDTIILQKKALIGGVIDGDGGYDVLIIDIKAKGAEADALRAILAAQPSSGSVTIKGRTYTWQNIEEIRWTKA